MHIPWASQQQFVTIIQCFSFCVLALTWQACKTTTPSTTTSYTQEIHTAPGPEDFVLDTLSGSSPRFLISASQRRRNNDTLSDGFYAFDLSAKEMKTMVRINEPEHVKVHPHGIDLVKSSSGAVMLYAVNHQQVKNRYAHSVIQYEVKQDSLFFVKQYFSPWLSSPNEVAALADGSFFVSNDSKRTKGIMRIVEKLFRTRSTRVVHFTSDDTALVVIDKLPFSNGLALRHDTLFVACTFKKVLRSYRISSSGKAQLLDKYPGVKGMDNITWYHDYLVIASHPSFGDFFRHYKKPHHPSPGLVTLFPIDKSHSPTTIFSTDGRLISANSTALIFRDTLYLGQVFNDFLLETKPSTLPVRK